MDPIGSDLSSQNVTIDTAKNVAGHLKKIDKKTLVFVYNPVCHYCKSFHANTFGPFIKQIRDNEEYNSKVKIYGINAGNENTNVYNEFFEKNAILHVPAVLKFEKGHDGIGEYYDMNQSGNSMSLLQFLFGKQKPQPQQQYQTNDNDTQSSSKSLSYFDD